MVEVHKYIKLKAFYSTILPRASSIQDKGVMHHIEMQNLFDGVLDILNPGIAEFHNLMAIRTNQMIMLLVPIRLPVLRQVFTKLVFTDQIAFDQ